MKVFKSNDHYYMEDNGNQVEVFLEPDGKSVKLPSNSVGRVYCNISKLEKNNWCVDYGTTPKTTSTTSSTTSSSKAHSVSFNIEDYLFDEDLTKWKELVAKAQANASNPLIVAKVAFLKAKAAYEEAQKAEKAQKA